MLQNKNKNSATEKYIDENEYVMQLPVLNIHANAKIYKLDSVFYLLMRKLRALWALKVYLTEVVVGRKWLMKLWKLKGSRKKNEALVIGNGPSQGYLDKEMLSAFKKNKGSIFVVNFWSENLILSEIIPDYIVVSDPSTLASNIVEPIIKTKNERLSAYILKHDSIKIICPVVRCEELANKYGRKRIIGFIDSELRMWSKNINPLLPRGYLSMTLYKTLAMAIWFDFKNIYIIGMDNTYPRNIYCNNDNKYINHEIHAGCDDFATDMSEMFPNISDGLIDIAHLFYDARKFKRPNINNLDQYSLTDAFNKVSFIDWVKGLRVE